MGRILNKSPLSNKLFSLESVNFVTTAKVSTGTYLCRAVDIDGTVLKEEWLNTGDIFTLPALPTNHDRLVATGWVSSCPDLDQAGTSTVVTKRDIMAGPVYETKSGMVEVIVEITEDIAPNIETEGHTVTVNFNGTKYWDYEGDKTITDTTNTHTYYSYGTYIIAIEGATGYDSTEYILSSHAIRKLYFTSSDNGPETLMNIGHRYNCSNLTELSLGAKIKSHITGHFNYVFPKAVIYPAGLESFQNILTNANDLVIPSTAVFTLSANIAPSGIIKYPTLVFDKCNTTGHYLRLASIRNSVARLNWPRENYGTDSILQTLTEGTHIVDLGCITSVPAISFSPDETLVFPATVTSLYASTQFRNCYNLTKIIFEGDITDVGSTPFNYLERIQIIDFSKNTVVPTCSSFSDTYLSTNYKIIVPDSLYDEWISTAPWNIVANHIYKKSEINYS